MEWTVTSSSSSVASIKEAYLLYSPYLQLKQKANIIYITWKNILVYLEKFLSKWRYRMVNHLITIIKKLCSPNPRFDHYQFSKPVIPWERINRRSSDTIYQSTVIIPYVRCISETFRRIGNRFNVRTIFNIKTLNNSDNYFQMTIDVYMVRACFFWRTGSTAWLTSSHSP
jgi:hypothetical protein